MTSIKVHVLGSGGSKPTVKRNLPCIYIKGPKSNFLLDVGQNAQQSILKYGLPFFIDAIVISHYHYDHIGGLIGLLNSMKLLERRTPLKIFCPNSKQLLSFLAMPFFFKDPSKKTPLIEKQLSNIYEFPIELIEINPFVEYQYQEFVLSFFKVKHSIVTYGVHMVSKNNNKYDKEKLELQFDQTEISTLIKEGKIVKKDKEHLKEDFLISEDPYFSVVYAGDCTWDPTILSKFKKSLIIHQCTHLNQNELKASQKTLHTNFHSIVNTPNLYSILDTSEIYLLLVHFGSRADPTFTRTLQKDLLSKTNKMFLAQDGFEVEYESKSCTFKHIII